ncbi:MAG: VOC family protein [Cyanobacteria bacterium]|nr:VOC family protein [Cyanobacteriota bacterium]
MADRLLGSFVWCELMTTDTAAAESFYKKVAGWSSVPFAPDGSYTVFNNASGAGVGGVMKLPGNATPPPNWLMYIGTPNVDDTAMRVAQLGGKVIKQPETIPNTGRYAVVQDPYGAAFGIDQPEPGRPSRPEQPAIGDFSWFELYTPNPEGAWNFYQKLFGWEKTSAMDMGAMGTYQMFGRGGGIPRGGIMKPPPGAPPSWAPYALVKDAKAAAAAATANGGKIVNGPMEVPGGDWIAQGIDPQGAMFCVHSLKPGAGSREQGAGKATKKAAPAKKTKPAKKAAKKKTAAKKNKIKPKMKLKGRRQKAKGKRQRAAKRKK